MKDYTKKNFINEINSECLRNIKDDDFEFINESKNDIFNKFTYYLHHYYFLLYKYRDKTEFEGYHFLKKITFEIKNHPSNYLFGAFFILNFDKIFKNEISVPQLVNVIDARDFLFSSLNIPIPFLFVPNLNLEKVNRFRSTVLSIFPKKSKMGKQIFVFEENNMCFVLMDIGTATYLNLDYFINDVLSRKDIYNVFLGFVLMKK